MKEQKALGIIGLGVMGRSLALNCLDKGISLSVYNRHVPGVEVDIARKFSDEHSGAAGFDDLAGFVSSLERPRRILIMVNAGKAVDSVIEHLLPALAPGDLVMDGGNSFYLDTERRIGELSPRGIHFLGVGISGGEEGARKGPSLMPGGEAEGYRLAAPYLETIAAKDRAGKPCCAYIGPGGAGHFVKMVHNGIEYGEMQLLAEIYQLMRQGKGLPPGEISQVFDDWLRQGLDSFLLEITRDILLKKEDGKLLLDNILDAAEQKGTGGWSSRTALELGVPLNTISDAVSARMISAMKEERVRAASVYQLSGISGGGNFPGPEQVKDACAAAQIINHAIGFDLIRQASADYGWNLRLSEIARVWTQGCIIRSGLMNRLAEYLNTEHKLLIHPEIVTQLNRCLPALSMVTTEGLRHGMALPVLSASLNYLLGYATAESPANLIQAQRDYFGAHTYRRKDRPAGHYYHTNWKE